METSGSLTLWGSGEKKKVEKIAKRKNSTISQQWQNRINRALGGYFEDRIKNGCIKYQSQGRAEIHKTPEPFHVIQRLEGLKFIGNFVGRAQPDFGGTLAGGRSIHFEAKYTDTLKMQKDVVKPHQAKALALHHKLGAVTGVCVGIKLRCFFIPWTVWEQMEKIWGRKYVTADDLTPVSREQVRRGEWEKIGADYRGQGGIWRCTECRKTYPYKCDFCPNCGTPMTDEAVEMMLERLEALHET